MIVLVRHARSVPPTPGGPDELRRPLTAEGLAQARRLGPELAALRPVAVVSSPCLRAVQTVAPAAALLGLPVTTAHDLREWDSGIPPTPDWAREHAVSWADPAAARPGGESLDAVSARAVAAVGALTAHGGTVVVGSHGTFVARLLAGLGVRVDWPFARDMPMPAIYRLTWESRVVSGPGLDHDTV